QPGHACPTGIIPFGCDPSADNVDCPPSNAQCSLDHGTFVNCDALAYTYTGLGDGSHSLVVHADDACGNQGPDATTSFIVEAEAPSVGAIGVSGIIVGDAADPD